MTNVFAEYKSGDIDPSSMKTSYKVSEIIDKPFRIFSMKKLDKPTDYSSEPYYLVNSVMEETGEDFIFFTQQKVLFDKIGFLEGMMNDKKIVVSDYVFTIRKVATKDGKSFYYDIFDISSQ